MRWTTVPRPYGLDDAHAFLAEIERDWSAPRGVRRWAVTDAADPEGGYLGTIDLRPGGGGVAEVGFGLHPEGRGSGLHGRRAAARLPLVVRRGRRRRVHWLAVRGNFASWRVAWSCGFTHHGTIPQSHPDPDDPSAPALDVWRASLGADDVMEPRTPWEDVPVLEADGGARHPAAAVARRRRRPRSSPATSPTTTCRRGGCSTPTPSPSG